MNDKPGRYPDFCFDAILAILAHTIMNRKQWEIFYWPTLKRILDVIVSKDKTIYLFIEGSFKRFAEYLPGLPEGSYLSPC